MVSADPLEEPSLPLEMLDPSRFWHGINAGLADRWLIGSRPSLFLLPEDQLHLVVPVLLLVLRKARLGRIVEQVTRKYSFGSINQEKGVSASRPIGSCPQSPQY